METKITSPSSAERPRSALPAAEIAVAGITVIVGIAAWFAYTVFLDTMFLGDGVSVTFIAGIVILFCWYLSLVVIVLTFSSARVAVFGTAALALTPLIVFASMNLAIALLAAAGFAAALAAAGKLFKKAYGNQIAYFLPGIIRLGLSALVFFTILAISLIHYASVKDKQDISSSVEHSLIRYSVSGINLFLSQFEGYTPSMSLDAFIQLAITEKLIKQEDARMGLPRGITEGIPLQQFADSLLDEQRQAIRSEFLQSLAIADRGISGDTPIAAVWEAYLETRSSRLIAPYGRFIPAIVSLGVFLGLLFVSKLFKLCIYAFAWMNVSTLRLAGALKYKEETITAKRLGY